MNNWGAVLVRGWNCYSTTMEHLIDNIRMVLFWSEPQPTIPAITTNNPKTANTAKTAKTANITNTSNTTNTAKTTNTANTTNTENTANIANLFSIIKLNQRV